MIECLGKGIMEMFGDKGMFMAYIRIITDVYNGIKISMKRVVGQIKFKELMWGSGGFNILG